MRIMQIFEIKAGILRERQEVLSGLYDDLPNNAPSELKETISSLVKNKYSDIQQNYEIALKEVEAALLKATELTESANALIAGAAKSQRAPAASKKKPAVILSTRHTEPSPEKCLDSADDAP